MKLQKAAESGSSICVFRQGPDFCEAVFAKFQSCETFWRLYANSALSAKTRYIPRIAKRPCWSGEAVPNCCRLRPSLFAAQQLSKLGLFPPSWRGLPAIFREGENN